MWPHSSSPKALSAAPVDEPWLPRGIDHRRPLQHRLRPQGQPKPSGGPHPPPCVSAPTRTPPAQADLHEAPRADYCRKPLPVGLNSKHKCRFPASEGPLRPSEASQPSPPGRALPQKRPVWASQGQKTHPAKPGRHHRAGDLQDGTPPAASPGSPGNRDAGPAEDPA